MDVLTSDSYLVAVAFAWGALVTGLNPRLGLLLAFGTLLFFFGLAVGKESDGFAAKWHEFVKAHGA